MAEKKKESTRSILIEIRSILKWFFSVDGAVITLFLLIIAALGAFVIQDSIQRQRYLELLELEIRSDQIQANSEIQAFNTKGSIYIHTPYKTKVYDAGLQSGYILTLDPSIQSQLFVLYNVSIPGENKLADHAQEIMDYYYNNWEHCIIDSLDTINKTNLCSREKTQMDFTDKTYSKFLKDDATSLINTITKIKFNPTQERLHSLLLRLFMGDKRLKVQE
jgi:hypothetical protein